MSGNDLRLRYALEQTAHAPELVQRLLHAVGSEAVAPSASPPLPITCSIGWDLVAVDTTASFDIVLSSSDHRLYEAKRSGRDCACGPDQKIVRRQ